MMISVYLIEIMENLAKLDEDSALDTMLSLSPPLNPLTSRNNYHVTSPNKVHTLSSTLVTNIWQ